MLQTIKGAVSGDIQVEKSDRLFQESEASGLGDLGGHHKHISLSFNRENVPDHPDRACRVKRAVIQKQSVKELFQKEERQGGGMP